VPKLLANATSASQDDIEQPHGQRVRATHDLMQRRAISRDDAQTLVVRWLYENLVLKSDRASDGGNVRSLSPYPKREPKVPTSRGDRGEAARGHQRTLKAIRAGTASRPPMFPMREQIIARAHRVSCRTWASPTADWLWAVGGSANITSDSTGAVDNWQRMGAYWRRGHFFQRIFRDLALHCWDYRLING
jgi:hypothetical protein